VLQALRRNFGLKLFSFAVAVAAWAYFRFAAAPSITAQFDQQLNVPITVVGPRLAERAFPVTIRYAGADNGLVISEIEVTPAEVTVRATTADLDRIQTVFVSVPFPSAPATYDAMVKPTVLASGIYPPGELSPNLIRVRAVFLKGEANLR
jgi:hypothetical protein